MSSQPLPQQGWHCEVASGPQNPAGMAHITWTQDSRILYWRSLVTATQAAVHLMRKPKGHEVVHLTAPEVQPVQSYRPSCQIDVIRFCLSSALCLNPHTVVLKPGFAKRTVKAR